MDFVLTEEQKQIKALIKEFAKKEMPEKWVDELLDKAAAAKTVEDLRAVYPVDLIKKMHDVGLRQLCVPTKYGGGGACRLGSVTRAVAAEQTGYSMGLGSRILGVPWMHCAAIAGYQTTEEQKDWFFSQFMEDPTMMVAMVMSEPQGTSDISIGYSGPGAQMNTHAHKEGNEWVINGDKMFSSGAPVAGLMRVAARIDKEKPIRDSMTFFWVKKDTPGVSYIVNRMCIDEVIGNAQVNLNNVRVPESHLLGQLGKGHLAAGELYGVKMLLYIEMFGHAQKIYEHIVDYAKQRVQGGRPIIQHSSIAAMLGDLALKLEAVRSFAYRGAAIMDEREAAGEPLDNFWSGGTMYLVKKVCWEVCEVATEVYGGIGSSVDMPLERFMRRTFSWTPPGNTPSMNAITASMGYNQHTLG